MGAGDNISKEVLLLPLLFSNDGSGEIERAEEKEKKDDKELPMIIMMTVKKPENGEVMVMVMLLVMVMVMVTMMRLKMRLKVMAVE
ncbi:hypothetical protein TWF481_007525 [Arthrobotrys musiformis]|uniref:Uncharacterized protein n=1 Tax=Arthrobotrys musiformis TaxID=47236 RepID=A0AAV9WE13_9PEZI